MLSVDEAVIRIVAAFAALPPETVVLEKAFGRTLAQDVRAAMAQPPDAVSAMDGYAVRSADHGPRTLIGSAPAGHPFGGTVGPGEAVRIFTGATIPKRADAIIIQENVTVDGQTISFADTPTPGRFIRAAGLDFAAGEILAKAGQVLTARDLALLAAGDVTEVIVRRKPRIAFAATGDELSRPGSPRKPGGIVASSPFGLKPLIEQWGAEAHDLGILPDTVEAVAGLGERAGNFDLLLTLGGASVGEHDLVQKALGPKGFVLDFWKIAMRPGRPLIFGRLNDVPLIGLPGNPVASLVCALLFVKPAIAALLGRAVQEPLLQAKLDGNLPANDSRQDYIRAVMQVRDGLLWARPHPIQDSSMLKVLAQSDALIVRAPHAPALEAGADIEILKL